MEKLLTLLALLVILVSGCGRQDSAGITISGDISGIEPGDIVSCLKAATNPDSIGSAIITCTVDDKGKFRLQVPLGPGQGDWYQIWIGGSPQPSKTMSLFLDNEDVHIKGEGGFSNAVLSGGQDVSNFNKYLSEVKRIGTSKVSDEEKRTSYTNFVQRWISANTGSALSLALLEQFQTSGRISADSIIAYYKLMKPSALNNLPAQRLKKWIISTADVAINQSAPDFTLPDTSGKKVSLSDFRGKYVLVDFWASWCGPCRAENPNVVKAYHLYKDKIFTIIGVSLDQENGKEAWLNAIRKDGLVWTQVSDLKYFENAAAKLYHVNAIPTNFLISPEGVIVARNLRGEALEKKLAEVLP